MFDARLQITEMRHRMASDLALLADVLERQRHCRVSTAGETLDDAIGSILTLAAHYKQLFEPGQDPDFVDLPIYVGALGRSLRTTYLDRLGVRLDCRIADVAVPPAAASDIGRILVAVIANAARHAAGTEGGRIIVTLSDTDAALVFKVVDWAYGPDDRRVDLGFSELQLAARRAATLGGRLDIREHLGGLGLAVTLTIPDRRRSPRPRTWPY